MPVPNSFANVTTSIPLSQLDANFNTPITLGNTAIQLGNTVTTLNNMTLANVTISSGNVTITNVSVTTANVTTANIANVIVTGTGTFAAGSNTAPSITTSGDTNTGIFFPAADTIAFTEGGVESARFDSSGRFGVGYTSMNTTLAVNGNALIGTGAWPINDFGRSGSRFVNASSTEDGNLAIVNMQSGVAANRGGYLYLGGRATTGVDGATFASVQGLRENATSGNYSSFLGFSTTSSGGVIGERARFNSTGALVFAGGTTTADGIGITFPATQSASSNANTLDDYEEGTWTVTLRDNAGGTANNSKYSVRLGDYTKVGNLVSLRFAVQLDGTSGATGTLGASGLQIGGIPFTAASGLVSASIYLYSGFTGAGFQKGMATAYMSGNVFTEIFNGGQNLLGTNATNSFYMWGNIVYTV